MLEVVTKSLTFTSLKSLFPQEKRLGLGLLLDATYIKAYFLINESMRHDYLTSS